MPLRGRVERAREAVLGRLNRVAFRSPHPERVRIDALASARRPYSNPRKAVALPPTAPSY
jgi:hypothetical protein